MKSRSGSARSARQIDCYVGREKHDGGNNISTGGKRSLVGYVQQK